MPLSSLIATGKERKGEGERTLMLRTINTD
jgi:hypothetical protein